MTGLAMVPASTPAATTSGHPAAPGTVSVSSPNAIIADSATPVSASTSATLSTECGQSSLRRM